MAQAKKPVKAEPKTTVKKTNYEKYKEEILSSCTFVPCNKCLARNECSDLCKERGINPAKELPPCKDAWKKWADKKS